VALLARQHGGRKAEDQTQRAKEIELHGALEVMEPIERMLHRAANRAPGVVNEDVDVAMVRQHGLAEPSQSARSAMSQA
jgi:hypothetical protein